MPKLFHFANCNSLSESVGCSPIPDFHVFNKLAGAARLRTLPPHEFCKQGFVLGKASEAGFGNEMYRILTAAALSVMLNRSLIIDQTRHARPHTLVYFSSIFLLTRYLVMEQVESTEFYEKASLLFSCYNY